MSGIIGGSSAKTDRGNQLAATQADWNLFSYGLPKAQEGQAAGTADLNTAKATLGDASQYWRNLLYGGRTQTAQNAAPAVNQVMEDSAARRNAEGAFGTDRVGGTVASNREASTREQSKIDDIINANLFQGKAAGAQGLERTSAEEANIGSTELNNALRLLGISSDSVNAILSNSTESRKTSNAINRQAQEDYGAALGQILKFAFMT